MSFGGSSEKSESQQTANSTSQGSSFNNTFLDPMQNAFRQSLFGGANALAGQQQNAGDMAAREAGRLGGYGSSFLDQLMGIANPANQIAAQEKSLSSGLADLFAKGQNSNRIDAMGAGAFGGSRRAIPDALLGGEIAKAYTGGLGDITARANAGATQAAGVGMGALPSLYNLGMSPMSAQWAPFMNLASILGPASILSQGGSQQTGSSSSQGSSASGKDAFNLGFSF